MARGFIMAHAVQKILLSVVAAGAVLAAHAQSDEGAWRMESLYASSYVFRGVERAHASAQATVDYSQGNFRAAGWANRPFSGASNEADEFNLSAGYAYAPSHAIALEFVATHAWFDHVPGRGVNRSFEVGVNATFAAATWAGFTPTVGAYHDFRFEADTCELSCARSIPMPKLGTFLELNFFAGWSAGENWRPDASGAKLRDGYGYWGGEARVPYQIGRFALMAGVHYASTTARSVLSGPFQSGSGVNLWVTLGASIEF